MKKILGRQYWIPKPYRKSHRVSDSMTIDKFVDECIASFIKVDGYRPTLMTAQQEILSEMHVRRDIAVQFEKVQRNHIRLYEVVQHRQPRILSTKRIPVVKGAQ